MLRAGIGLRGETMTGSLEGTNSKVISRVSRLHMNTLCDSHWGVQPKGSGGAESGPGR